MVQVTLKHLLVPNGYIPGMSLIFYSASVYICTYRLDVFCCQMFNKASDLWAVGVCTVQCCLFYFW